MSNVPSFNQAIVDSREQLESGRERLKQQHQSGSPGIQVCTGISDLFDDIVLNLVNLAFDQVTSSESERQQLEQVIAVVAHGGYGRRDVAPYSDIDLMLLCFQSDAPLVPELARALSQNIYDVGLQL